MIASGSVGPVGGATQPSQLQPLQRELWVIRVELTGHRVEGGFVQFPEPSRSTLGELPTPTIELRLHCRVSGHPFGDGDPMYPSLVGRLGVGVAGDQCVDRDQLLGREFT